MATATATATRQSRAEREAADRARLRVEEGNELIRAFGGVTSWPSGEPTPAYDPTDAKASLLRHLETSSFAAMVGAAEDFAGRVAAATVDPALSPEGKAGRIADALDELRQSVRAVADGSARGTEGLGAAASHVRQARAEVQSIRGQLDKALRPEPGDLAAALRQGEIRTHLAALDDTARRRAVARAIQAQDGEVLGAIVTAPALYALGTDAELAEARTAALRALLPEGAERLADLERSLDWITGGASAIGRRGLEIARRTAQRIGAPLEVPPDAPEGRRDA